MNSSKRETWIAVAAIPFVFAALYPLQARIDRVLIGVQQEPEEIVFRSPKLVRAMCLGYESFFADIYWTRAVQYYGAKHHARDPHYDLLGGMLDIATTLDPHLIVAYKFGAIFLAQAPPQGAGRPDLAVELIRRGIAQNPEEWRFWADLGFIDYWELRDYKKASEAYLEGSRQPGAAPWMKPMAAQLAAQGGSRDASIFLWNEIYSTSTNEYIRKNAAEHLQALKAEADLEALGKIVAEYKARFGRAPNSMAELIAAKLLAGYPADPAGYRYILGPEGEPRVDPTSPVQPELMKPGLP